MPETPSPAPVQPAAQPRHGARPRVIVAGLGDTGLLVATRLARTCDVVGISTRPALVSGQELGNRLTDPDRWRRSYLVPFHRFRGLDRIRTVHGRISSVDLTRREVHVEGVDGDTAVETYDLLVIATGASNGFWRHDRIEDLQAIDDDLAAVSTQLEAATSVAVVGGGATGVSVADNLARRGGAQVHLFHSGDEPLPGYHPKVRRWIVRELQGNGVELHPGHRAELPDGFTGDRLTTGPVSWSSGQEPFEADITLWAVGGMRPHSRFLPRELLDDDGFVRVDEHLRVPGHPNVFAVGDVAASDPFRSSARNWGWQVVVANVKARTGGRDRKLKRYQAPEHRWGSILGLQDDGLVVFQPDGKRVRIPRWIAEPLLFRLFTTRYLYGGLRPHRPGHR
ncbi:NAD(P)/FAD-dependent oxidoreductase [Aquihabitans sp. McL0605]|uniref:NAD(P)/FAD-dependent oxidoreductase n=1 Tax=Aquihabitans sp. McL0605 TaxID=3415671 RepID=UPI003CED3A18